LVEGQLAINYQEELISSDQVCWSGELFSTKPEQIKFIFMVKLSGRGSSA
jgi:hypothetical protein